MLIFAVFMIVCLSYALPIPLMLQRVATVMLVIYVVNRMYSKQKGLLLASFRRFFLLLGTNTMEIYFLHYFLLFPMPESIGNYLESISRTDKSLSLPEFLIVGSAVVAISLVCIMLSRILKQIPYVSLLAFGKNTK